MKTKVEYSEISAADVSPAVLKSTELTMGDKVENNQLTDYMYNLQYTHTHTDVIMWECAPISCQT